MTQEQLQEIFQSGDYQIDKIRIEDNEDWTHATIQADGATIYAYPYRKKANVIFEIDLTDEQAKELNIRIVERQFNAKKAEMVKLEQELNELDAQLKELGV